MVKIAFIIGSPRSGTTLVGDILDLHPQIGRWYEPYFVLDRYFRNAPNDCRTAADATDDVKAYISHAFDYYRIKYGCSIVVDKSPRNSLKIPFLRQIFPEAKFIHILRDGRDSILSIHRQWVKRQNIGSVGNRNYWQIIRTVKNFLIDPQPLLVHKIAALQFEMGGAADILKGQGFLHKLRWDGRVGWGPQFAGWQQVIDEVSTLEFNALQWAKCVKTVKVDSQKIDKSKFLEIRYESFLKHPQDVLERVFTFLESPFPGNFMSQLPVLKGTNYNKWKDVFSDKEKALIGPIVNPLLVQLGYANDDSWYKHERD